MTMTEAVRFCSWMLPSATRPSRCLSFETTARIRPSRSRNCSGSLSGSIAPSGTGRAPSPCSSSGSASHSLICSTSSFSTARRTTDLPCSIFGSGAARRARSRSPGAVAGLDGQDRGLLLALRRVRDDFPEHRQVALPFRQEYARPWASGFVGVPLDDRAQHLSVFVGLDALDPDQIRIVALLEPIALVEHVGDAVGHTGAEVAAGLAEDDRDAGGHVLAAVVAGALGDRQRARVADAEALA